MNRKALCLFTLIPTAVVGAIIMIALLALSIQDVDFDEVAIVYHKVTRVVDSDIKREGRHTLTPDAELITYPSRFVTYENTVPCLSEDGIDIPFQVSIQYQITSEDLHTILFNFGDDTDFEPSIDLAIIDTAKDVCSQFAGEQYSSLRGQAEQTLAFNISNRFALTPSHITVGFSQLRNIAIAPALARAIDDKQEALERVDVALTQRAQVIIEKQTAQLGATEDVRILLVQATADAQSILFSAEQVAGNRRSVWDERQQAILFGMEALKMNASEFLSQYLWPNVLAQAVTPSRQACLQHCQYSGDCWACWLGSAVPAISPR